MSTSVLSLAAYQGRQLREAFRRLAHEALDRLLDRLAARMDEQPTLQPTLFDLTQVVLWERAGCSVPRKLDRWLSETLRQPPPVQRGS